MNSDCMSTRACIRSKCQDPCPGACGTNAECQVVNHLPTCTCFPGYTGQPYQYCQPITQPGKWRPYLLLLHYFRFYYNSFLFITQLKIGKIRVPRRPVDQIVSAKLLMIKQFVPVYLNILVPHLDVDQNAWLALNVHRISRVLIRNAKILVLDHAVSTQNVTLFITVPSVPVDKGTQVIRLHVASQCQVRKLFSIIIANNFC